MSLTLTLASQSPRRVELLTQLGLPFVQCVAAIDEMPLKGEIADDYVCRMALEKALAVQAKLKQQDVLLDQRLVLGADTIIEFESTILGKPQNFEHFNSMMKTLSGNEHCVKTAIWVLLGEQSQTTVVETKVAFKSLSSEEIMWYWNTGEPQDKAGGYAIQGKGAQFVAHLSGSYSGVVGLPLFETSQLLKHMGMSICERRITD